MARRSTFYLMFMLLGLVLLGLLVYAGITSQQHVFGEGDENTQDLNADATNSSIEQVKPVAIGMGGLIMIFGVVFGLAGIGVFAKIIFGKGRSRDL
jgi:hypothetical protein